MLQVVHLDIALWKYKVSTAQVLKNKQHCMIEQGILETLKTLKILNDSRFDLVT